VRESVPITKYTTKDGKERMLPVSLSINAHKLIREKSSWDEWVPEDRVLPPTEENYAQQQKLRELANPIPAPAPKKKSSAPEGKKAVAAAGADSAVKGVKRSRDHDVEKV
jgi:hypothetical protein